MVKLSLTMIVKNESRSLARCLDSVTKIVNEIIIVDTGSTDNTKEIAKKYNAKIFDFKWCDDFSAARNFALEQSTGDWNLILDADEYITNDCKKEISNFIENNKPFIGRIKIISNFEKGNQVEYAQSFISRLIPKGVKFTGKVHEQLDTSLDRKILNVEVNHDGYFKTDKSDRNLKILFNELNKKPNDYYVLYHIAKTYRILNRHADATPYFEKCYRKLVKDSEFRSSVVVDYMYNIIETKHFDNGLEIINTEKENLYDCPDFHFVCGLFYMDLILSDVSKYMNYLPLIENEYLTCLKLGESEKYDSVVGTGSFAASYNLAVYYETTGDMKKAKHYYEISASLNYNKAKDRLLRI